MKNLYFFRKGMYFCVQYCDLKCVKDVAEVIRDSGIQLANDELQKLATTLFIARSKAA